MSRPKYAGKVKRVRKSDAPIEGVLVPRDEDLPIVREAIARNPELAAYAQITATHILQTWGALATADINEAVRLAINSCRYCHGIDHAYQWVDQDEWAEKVAYALDHEKEPPSSAGGFGFDPRIKPHPECPRCFGRGEADLQFTDPRDWSPEMRLLYNGAKFGKYGIELQFRDRDKLMELAARHLGMLKERVEHSGKNGAPIQFVLSPVEAAL